MSVAELEATEIAFEAPSGLWRDAWQRLKRNPGAIVGFLFVLVFVVCAIFAPWLAPHKPLDQDLSLLGKNGIPPGPSSEHWFGVDTLGRDEFSRILYGARLSLLVGVVSVAVGLSFGIVLCQADQRCDVTHPIRLLRTRRNRPRGGAADSSDKFPALDHVCSRGQLPVRPYHTLWPRCPFP